VVLLDLPKSAGGRADFLLYQSILIGCQDRALLVTSPCKISCLSLSNPCRTKYVFILTEKHLLHKGNSADLKGEVETYSEKISFVHKSSLFAHTMKKHQQHRDILY
jgi:hypothetical protein